MPISEFDITKAKGYILHGCNCQGKMGAGLAKTIADKWPDVKRNYQDHLNKIVDRRSALGTIQVVSVENDSVQVVNCFTQEYYGRDKEFRYVSYDAIDRCMKDVVSIASTYHPLMDINIPKIGCSLGGGHWPVVLEIIKFRFASVKNRVIMWMPDENRKYELFEREISQTKLSFE